jgi:hypothetical protein
LSEKPKFRDGLAETIEGLYVKERFRDPKSIAELAESRTVNSYRLKTDATDVAQVIDFLIKEGRAKDEKPPVEPGLVAGLLPEPARVASPPSQATDNSSQAANETKPVEPEAEAEEPTVVTVLAFIKHPLAKGVTMTDLRQKIGHEKGKAWTARLNEYVDVILSLRKQHVKPNQIYVSLQEAYGNRMGSLVAALLTIKLQPNGDPPEAWEKSILCSNPKGASKEATKEAEKEGENRLGQSQANGTNRLPYQVDEYEEFWAVDGPGTMDDALNHI